MSEPPAQTLLEKGISGAQTTLHGEADCSFDPNHATGLGMSRSARRSSPTSRLRDASGSARFRARAGSGAGTRATRATFGALRVFLVALSLLVLQGPRQLHMLLVSHATCEHGDLVEVDHADSVRERAHRDATAEKGAAHDEIEAADDSRSDHDHCDARALRHLPTSVDPFIVGASLLDVTPLVVLDEQAEERPVALLSLAPKGSPPARAA
ncbi:Hypothetical protein A7982_08343 [Minicystis rosea]|nr:Hypothetical protein A7982_08343 [Minicystis rosea]